MDDSSMVSEKPDRVTERDRIAAELMARLGPEVAELARRIALKNDRPFHPVWFNFNNLANRFSDALVMRASKECLEADELDLSHVKHRIRGLYRADPPRYTHCTGGASSLEIRPNGKYARCSKLGNASQYMGHLTDEGPIKTLNVDTDDMGCDVHCPELMCFTRNVIRATDLDSFKAGVEKHGIKGVYIVGPRDRERSDIFIRWKLTDVCNYTCSYCTDWKSVNAKGVELTDDEIMQAARKILSSFDNIALRFTGGEPSARRCYVDLMRLFHSNLEKITNIEIRTNFSFQEKHKEVLSWDWNGKFHVHVGCHIFDKNFMPWRFIETIRSVPDPDYVFKFVANDKNREHVEFFKQYFVKHGVPLKRITVVEMIGKLDRFAEDEEAAADLVSQEPAADNEIPKARKTLEKMDPLERPATPVRRDDVFVRRSAVDSQSGVSASP